MKRVWCRKCAKFVESKEKVKNNIEFHFCKECNIELFSFYLR